MANGPPRALRSHRVDHGCPCRQRFRADDSNLTVITAPSKYCREGIQSDKTILLRVKVPSLFAPEPKYQAALKPAVRAGSGDFSRHTDAGKILLPGRLPGQVMFGRLQSIRRWAGNLSSSPPIPSRPSPWLRTCWPNMFCPGRQGRRDQAALP